jgi:zinc transport system permease protein
VDLYYLLLLLLIALTIVLLVNIVGVIMVIALLTLPASIAGQLTKRLWSMMIISIIGSICFTSSGLFIGYTTDLPTGPVIILIATVTFFIVHFSKIVYKWSKKQY